MPLNIENAEVDALARKLAERTGETITEAVLNALRERLERTRTGTGAALKEELAAIRKRCAELPECSIVVEARYGEAGGQQLDLLLSTARIRVVEVTADQVDIARDGFRRFGKGRHPAGLNFGDCFA